MQEILQKIKGRHWVFIVGLVLVAIVALYNTQVARYMVDLIFCIGIGMFLRG